MDRIARISAFLLIFIICYGAPRVVKADCDLTGWRVGQAGSTQNYTFGSVSIPAGGYLVLARNNTQGTFEGEWGALPAGTVYVNSGNKVPQINGSETYTLFDGSGTVKDGATPVSANPNGKSCQRQSTTGDGTSAGEWVCATKTSGNPGVGMDGLQSGDGDVLISEYSDGGSYLNEFVEIFCDEAIAPAGDVTSEVEVADTPFGGDILTVASGSEELVFNFQFVDWGDTDGLPTTVTELVIKPAPNNTADWSDTFGLARLYDAGLDQVGGDGVIADDGLTFSGLSLVVPDGGTVELSLAIQFSSVTGAPVDESFLAFQINSSADVTADASGSTFAPGDDSVLSDDFIADVVATKLVVDAKPASVVPNDSFTVSFQAVDAYGNVDIGYAEDVLLAVTTGTGAVSSASNPSLVKAAALGGVAWTDLKYSKVETFEITATDGNISDGLSGEITATNSQDLSNWTIEQSNGIILTIPAGTLLAPGGFLLVSRKATLATFEGCVGALPEGAQHIRGFDIVGGNGFPMVGSGRSWTLKDDSGTTVDGPTPASGNYAYDRDGADVATFTQGDRSTAETAGAWAKGSSSGKTLITEFADNLDFECEFIEIHFDQASNAVCGDGSTEGIEDCDDGSNGDDTDGCKDDCSFTCADHGDCVDADASDCFFQQCLAGGEGQVCESAPGTGLIEEDELCSGGQCDGGGDCVPSNIGKVIFSEFMPNPDGCDAGSDQTGEWFELYNTTGDAISLQNWIISKGAADYTIAGALSIAANDYFVVCLRNPAEAGLACDLQMGDVDIVLGNSGASLELIDDSAKVVDTAAYAGNDRAGESFALSPCHLNGVDNDTTAVNYCYATSTYTCDGGSDKGTPGAANLPCAGDACFSCNDPAADCAADVDGDCQAPACIAAGADYVCGLVYDDADTEDDNEACTFDGCDEGTPTHEGQADLACTTDPGGEDGWCSEAGACVADECGDGNKADDEACDDGANGDDADGCRDDCSYSCLADDDCADLNATNCLFPRCVSAGAGQVCEGNPGTGPVSAATACKYAGKSGTCNASGNCVVAASVGDVIITEFMANPWAVGSSCLDDTTGEWFEVKNTTLAAVDMIGWTIKDDASDAHVIADSFVVPAGGYAVLCRGLDGAGNHPDFCGYWFKGVTPFLMGNNGDEIILSANGDSGVIEVDRVEYAAAAAERGVSLELDPSRESVVGNDLAWAWCAASSGDDDMACGDLGSPGAQNASCGPLAIPPDEALSSAMFMGGVAADGHSLAVVSASLFAADGTPALGRVVEVSVDGDAVVFVPDDPSCTNGCAVAADANGDAIAYIKDATIETVNVTITDTGANPVGPYTGGVGFHAAISTDSALVGATTLSVAAGTFSQATSYDLASLPQGALPAGTSFAYGLFATTIAVTPGATATLTVTLDTPLVESNRLWKFGPSSAGAAPTWHEITTSDEVAGFVAGSSVYTISLTDGGFGDADGLENGVIVDPQGPGNNPADIPTLGEWAMILLLIGLLAVGLRRLRVLPGGSPA